MNIEPVKNIPETRSEFERHFNILSEAIRYGKVKFSRDVQSAINSLLKVRSLPNNRIDFLSVDELARSQANMMANIGNLKEKDLPKNK